MSIQRFEPNGKRLSHVVVNNGVVYVTGQTPVDRGKGISEQTAEVLKRLDYLLELAGSDKNNILFGHIWLKHVTRDFSAMNAVWESWIPHDALPARATVEANLAAEDILVEIALQARVK